MTFRFTRLFFAALLAGTALSAHAEGAKASIQRAPVLAIENVVIIPMTHEQALPGHTVIVRDGKIETLGAARDVRPPAGAKRIEGRGKYLVPGLADMHGHLMFEQSSAADPDQAFTLIQQFLKMFLAAGVTTVRDPGGTPRKLAIREALKTGRIIGPRLYVASPVLETRSTLPNMPAFGQRRLIPSAESGRQAVREAKAAGYDFVKVYNQIDAPIYHAIIEEAEAQAIPVIGHVPFAVGLGGALRAGQRSIEHLRGFDFALDTRPEEGRPFRRYVGWLNTNEERMRQVARKVAASGVWNCPTLVTVQSLRTDEQLAKYTPRPEIARAPEWLRSTLENVEYMKAAFSPEDRKITQEAFPNHLTMIRYLAEAGAPLLIGSDTPWVGITPGYSVHEELTLFVHAGLSPYQALLAATVEPARFLARDATSGTIEVGKAADLVLLEANPLEDIANVRKVSGVVSRGTWYGAAELREQ